MFNEVLDFRTFKSYEKGVRGGVGKSLIVLENFPMVAIPGDFADPFSQKLVELCVNLFRNQ